MKKQEMNNLELNKKIISKFKVAHVKAGLVAGGSACGKTHGSCCPTAPFTKKGNMCDTNL